MYIFFYQTFSPCLDGCSMLCTILAIAGHLIVPHNLAVFVIFIPSQQGDRRTGGGVPLPHKRPLSGHSLSLPTFLSVLTTLALAFHHNSHQSWRAFVLDFSLSSQNPGGNESPKSNIFCARVLSTEILALNWIRCRGSNSRTMKRQNSEAKPLLKCLSTLTQDQAIS